MADTNIYQTQANELSQKLWAIANELRGQMDASEFKNLYPGSHFFTVICQSVPSCTWQKFLKMMV